MDDTPETGQADPEQSFVDFAELLAALGDIVPTEGSVNAEGVLSARDFYAWFMHDGDDMLRSDHIVFPQPDRLREIARFIALAASVGASTGAP